MAKLSSCIDISRKIIGDKWKILIICNLYNGRKRLSELMYYIDGITQKVLTENLRELERMKIIDRKIYAEVPPRTEYFLTDIGLSVVPIIEQLISWALDYNTAVGNLDDIEDD